MVHTSLIRKLENDGEALKQVVSDSDDLENELDLDGKTRTAIETNTLAERIREDLDHENKSDSEEEESD
jgi:hypothetical protein